MHKPYLLIFLITVLGITSCCSNKGGFNTSKNLEKIALDSVLEQVNSSYLIAISQPDVQNYSIEEASVEFVIAKSLSAEGGFDIVVSGSKKWKKEQTTKVKFNLTSKTEKSGNKALYLDELSNIIIAAAKQFNKVTSSSTIGNLKKDSFEIEISFAVTKTADGGIKITVLGADLDGGIELEKSVEHTISLKFVPKNS